MQIIFVIFPFKKKTIKYVQIIKDYWETALKKKGGGNTVVER